MSKGNQDADPKSMVTPFAFEIAPKLLYIPLASPLKRGLAMTIDGLLVAVLAEQAGWVFILLVGLTLLIQKKSRQLGKFFKWGLYSLMLVMMLMVVVEELISSDSSSTEYDNANGVEISSLNVIEGLLGYGPQIVSFSQCTNINCAENELSYLLPAIKNPSLSLDEQTSIVTNLIDELPLSADEKRGLLVTMNTELNQLLNVSPSALEPNSAQIDSLQSQENAHSKELKDINAESLASQNEASPFFDEKQLAHFDQLDIEEKEQDEQYSLLAWAKGMLNDLGLGFGWAAFYFTVFTAWFDGQTLGKKLFRIRVVQLDGTGLSLWDSFGRYGGYGAGFATGLLGFLQIYWDANRQAIQDKISATVVIDLNRLTQEKTSSYDTKHSSTGAPETLIPLNSFLKFQSKISELIAK
jgi:hypothetical protein